MLGVGASDSLCWLEVRSEKLLFSYFVFFFGVTVGSFSNINELLFEL